jgi:beta-mannanase
MLPNPASGGGPYTLAIGAAGTYNAYFTTLASNLSAAGWNSKNCMIRLGWEFNGNWGYWSAPAGQEANFVTYWRNIVTAMRAVIPGLKFVWSPNMGNNWGSSALENYYPGSAYVNYVGLDVYDTFSGDSSTTWNDYLTMSYGLNWLAKFSATTGKPACIPEFGLGPPAGSEGGGDDPDFIARIAAWVSANSPAGYVSIWDPTEGAGVTTWAVPSGTSAPNSNAEFVNLFHDESQ